MKKRLVLSAFLFLTLAIAVFWQPVFISYVKWQLSSKSQELFSSKLNYDQIQIEGGDIIITHPSLESFISDTPNTIQFSADQARISYSLELLDWNFDADVSVTRPQLSYFRRAPDSLTLEQILELRSLLFNIPITLAIKEGSFELHDLANETSPTQKFYFQFDTQSSNDNLVSFQLHKNPEPGAEHTLDIELLKLEDEFQAAVTVKSVQCSDLLDTLSIFSSKPKTDWKVSDGTIDGYITLGLPEISQVPFVEGNIRLQDLSFRNPSLELSGAVKQATLSLEKKVTPDVFQSGTWLPTLFEKILTTSTGSIQLSEDAFLSHETLGVRDWEISKLTGSLEMDSDRTLELIMRGLFKRDKHFSPIVLEGKSLFNEDEMRSFGISFNILSDTSNDFAVAIESRPSQNVQQTARMKISNFGRDECAMLRDLLKPALPGLDNIKLSEGIIDADFELTFVNSYPRWLAIQEFTAEDLEVQLLPSRVTCRLSEIKGYGSLDLMSAFPLGTLEGEFAVVDGDLSWLEREKNDWHFSNIQAKLRFTRGMLHNSSIHTSLGDLKGTIDLNWFSPENMVNCNFEGKVNALDPFFPGLLNERVLQQFSDESISIQAKLQRQTGGLHLGGTLGIHDPEGATKNISFKAELEKISTNLWDSWLINNSNANKWIKLSNSFLKSVTPAVASPGVVTMSNWLKKEMGLNGIVIRSGHFNAESLPIEKYIAPFVFPEGKMQLSGLANMQGTFDHRRIIIKYLPEQITLENSHQKIDLDHSAFLTHAGNSENPLTAYHYFDLETFHDFGYIPVQSATYFDKTFQSSFSDIKAKIHLTKGHVRVSDINTTADNLNFTGNVDINYSDEDNIGVTINTESISGKIPDLQTFLSHFATTPLCKLPLKGSFSSENTHGYFHFLIRPNDLDFRSYVQGKVTNGSYLFDAADVALNDLSIDFNYDHEEKALEIHNLNGTWIAGKGSSSEELNFSSKKTRIFDFENPNVEFDLHFGDEIKEVARLVGTAATEEEDPSLVSFSFDNDQSHVGDILPNISKFTLRNWEEVAALHAEPLIRLNKLFEDARLILSPGFLPFNMSHIDDYRNFKLFGELNSKIDYDEEKEAYEFSALGEDIIFDKDPVENFYLSGSKKEKNWNIRQLQIDKLSLTADVEQKPENSWDVNFLSLRYGKSLVLGLEGQFFENEHRIKGDLKLFETYLDHLDELPSLEGIANLWKPQGSVRTTGTLDAAFQPEEKRWVVEANVNSSFEKFELLGVQFQDTENITCHYSTKDGLTANGVDLSFNTTESIDTHDILSLGRLHYSVNNGSWELNDMVFSLAPKSLKIIEEMSFKLLPSQTKSHQQLIHLIQNAKDGRPFQGKLSAQASPLSTSLTLELDNGEYFINNKKHFLKDFTLSKKSDNILLRSRYRVGKNDLYIHCKTATTEMENGELYVSEHPLEDLTVIPPPLKISWEKDKDFNISISQAKGNLSGLSFDLNKQTKALPKNKIALIGKVKIDWKEANLLLPEDFKRHVQKLGLGSGFEITGEFTFPQSNFDALTFNGGIHARNFDLLNHKFQLLNAQLQYDPNAIHLTKGKIHDRALNVVCDDLTLIKHSDGEWQLSIPLIKAEGLRPSLFRSSEKQRVRPKPLVVKNAELKDINASLSDPETFTGKGSLYFHNPAKKNLFNILFAIPNDLIARIGLDLNLLTPTMGNISYELRGSKVYLTKFSDVYSDGRRSKFFLSKNGSESFVDLDGNLDVKINMKQFNIIFKIAELFTISIKGTLDKPLYTLHKQSADEPLEHFAEDNPEENKANSLGEAVETSPEEEPESIPVPDAA